MIAVFFADGFEEIEALVPVDYLRRCELEVKMVGVSAAVKGSHGITVICDTTAEELDFQQLDGIVLPGGMPGTLNLEKNEAVKKAIQHCVKTGKPIGAICAAPSILGHMGLLEGKAATCYPGFEEQLTGATYTGAPVTIDGNIITSKGAGTSMQFAFALVERFCSPERAKILREGLQWQE